MKLLSHTLLLNPLVTDPLYLVCMAKILTLKKRDHRKNFL